MYYWANDPLRYCVEVSVRAIYNAASNISFSCRHSRASCSVLLLIFCPARSYLEDGYVSPRCLPGSNPPATFQLQNFGAGRAIDRNFVEQCGEILAQCHQNFSNRRIESHEENDHCCFSESDAGWRHFCRKWRESECLSSSGGDRRRGRLADTRRPAVNLGERRTF